MGSGKMDNSLIFMMYANTTGGVTLSPRFADGNTEPEYTKDIVIELRTGSGVVGGFMTANAVCQKCRGWKGGKVDPTNSKAPFIFATGPDENLKSNSLTASVKRHSNYGSFVMDLTKAMGAKTVPVADMSNFVGTTQNSNKRDRDLAPPFHAFFMIAAFVGFMPLAVFILRILNRPAWHGIAQSVSLLVALIGVALGFYIGTLYNRVRSLTKALREDANEFIDERLQVCSSDFRNHRHRSYDCSIRSGSSAPSHVQGIRPLQTSSLPYLAWPSRHSCRNCEWLLVRHHLPSRNITNIKIEVSHSP